ncbi:MAG: GatB/YqeY domain-containing protein [Alphaproteobacteria bacterium]|nr:GatB/YqeY domain-containing protein [Alphaproteobacteria bacterium]
MLRDRFSEALKEAMKSKAELTVSTVRLILARLKEKDIEARPKLERIDDTAIQQMLQQMIKQRRESIELYEKGNRPELAAKEKGEIAVIERFLPKQMAGAELESAIKDTIKETGAAGIKDMGKVMAALRTKYAGQLDAAAASQAVKKLLTG